MKRKKEAKQEGIQEPQIMEPIVPKEPVKPIEVIVPKEPVKPIVEKIDPVVLHRNVEKIINVVDRDPVLTWRKIGGGTCYINKSAIKPNRMVKLRKSEIPEALLKFFVCTDSEKLKELDELNKQVIKNVVPKYEVRPTSDGLFNVVNEYGKIINATPLSNYEAVKLHNSLEA